MAAANVDSRTKSKNTKLCAILWLTDAELTAQQGRLLMPVCSPVSRKYAPKCGGCGEPIAPKEGQTTTARLKVLDKDWHPECFKCKVGPLTSY